MPEFTYRNRELHVESVPLSTLAAQFGTPLYVYSRAHLIRQYRALTEAMAPVSPLICYAVKSNTCGAVIQTFAQLGSGADVVSGGELLRARKAGIPPERIVFAGVGKAEWEIELALREGILYFTVESEPELARISKVAQRTGTVGRIAIRVNPDVDPKTHKYTSTGKKENKFGVDLDRALAAYDIASRLPGLEITSIHMHLGSPIMTETPYAQALEKVMPVCETLKSRYPTFSHIDIGGGLGIPYRPDAKPFDLAAFAAAVIPPLQRLGLTVSMEPGRFLTGNAGVLLTRVEYIKENPFKKFIVIDAAMNDLIRPALYEAHHEIQPVVETSETLFGDLVGPVCESGDFLAANRDLPAVKEGDFLSVMSAGSYGFVMASTYNSRPRAAEVMVHGDQIELVREREPMEELTRGERYPEWR
ncbi:MAG TPA: diaminopimelate decarboxylase [Kiritimatiellia bacterium]|nr:diaminopimelate decarboxylase [Kiritimatiellia bacterium]